MADPTQIAHLLRRTEFVARPERVNALSGLSLAAAIDDIMGFAGGVELPTYLNNPVGDSQGYQQWVYATKWWLDRMVDAPRPFQEKMTLFWHGHFTSAWQKVEKGFLMCRQNKLYRDMAIGNFRDLTQAMAVQPAMLLYLDNDENVKGSPNQNFARELMELFTLGVGNYSEADVEAAAQAWTGFTINETAFTYEFHGEDHDYGDKTFFGVTKAWSGPDIIDEILVNNAGKRAVAARFITKKLWEFFAYQNPSAALLDQLAPGFAADWNIRSLLKNLFLRPEFYSTDSLYGQVRSPIDWVVAAMYHSGLRSEACNPQWTLEGMGQRPFNPPNVSGWRLNGYWINTSAMGSRGDFARQITWKLRNAGVFENMPSMTIDQAIDTAATMYALHPLSSTTRAAMATYLTAQRASGPGWWEGTNMLTLAMLAPEMHAA